MSKPRKIVFSGLCIALGIMLPVAFHSIPNAGMIFLPMHISILLCGLVCGWQYGICCGILTPLLSSLLTGMPLMIMLLSMIPELAVYGLVTGILITAIKTKSPLAKLYAALVVAMLCGRVTYGILNSLIFRAGEYSINAWLTTAFITSLPGIAIQLLLLPPLVLLLKKAKIIN